MSQDYVETRDGGYYVVGSRVSLDSIVYAFLAGQSAEAIGQAFTVLTLEQVYGAVAYYLAHRQEIDEYLAAQGERRTVPVVNLQCDVDHPTQALADLVWAQECQPGGLAGKKVAVTWAYSPSYAKPLSVPQGLVTLLTRFGAHVTLAQPEGYRLMDEPMAAAAANAQASGGSFRTLASMDEAFAGAHAVYPKSWGPWDLMQERVAANRKGDKAAMADIEKRALERNARHRDWICDERRMGLTKDALYLHCLPADIGAEVSPGVMERFRVDVAREANKKVYVIMALLAAAKVPDLAVRLEALDSPESP